MSAINHPHSTKIGSLSPACLRFAGCIASHLASSLRTIIYRESSPVEAFMINAAPRLDLPIGALTDNSSCLLHLPKAFALIFPP
jgi:hypothetical protein